MSAALWLNHVLNQDLNRVLVNGRGCRGATESIGM